MKQYFLLQFIFLNIFVYAYEYNTIEENSGYGTYFFYEYKDSIFDENKYFTINGVQLKYPRIYEYVYDIDVLYNLENLEEVVIHEQNITIREFWRRDEIAFTFRYYTTDQDEIVNKYYNQLVKTFLLLIDDINASGLRDMGFQMFREKNGEWVGFWHELKEIISWFDREDLAIFRNLLFAIHNYKFGTVYWSDFFSNHLENYNGVLNNSDSKNLFTENENELLNLIIEEENRS
jgi:hypothetical protein